MICLSLIAIVQISVVIVVGQITYFAHFHKNVSNYLNENNNNWQLYKIITKNNNLEFSLIYWKQRKQPTKMPLHSKECHRLYSIQSLASFFKLLSWVALFVRSLIKPVTQFRHTKTVFSVQCLSHWTTISMMSIYNDWSRQS